MIIYHPLLGSYMYLIRPVELVYFSNNILCAKITRMLVFGFSVAKTLDFYSIFTYELFLMWGKWQPTMLKV